MAAHTDAFHTPLLTLSADMFSQVLSVYQTSHLPVTDFEPHRSDFVTNDEKAMLGPRQPCQLPSNLPTSTHCLKSLNESSYPPPTPGQQIQQLQHISIRLRKITFHINCPAHDSRLRLPWRRPTAVDPTDRPRFVICLQHDRTSLTSIFHSMRHVRFCFPPQILRTVACSIIRAKLDYRNSILYCATNEDIHKLQLVQNSVTRLLTGTEKFNHTLQSLLNSTGSNSHTG